MGGIRCLRGRQRAGGKEERPGESRLDDKPVAGGEVEHHELGAPPAAEDARAADTARQVSGIDLAKHVRSIDDGADDRAAGDVGVQVARDRLGFR
jgi:hypothetical protein